MRICGDYKVTINPMLDVNQYPLPRPEDLFATLDGGKRFTKLDLLHTYNQLILDEESRPYLTINTHRGLYRYNRGVASAPAVFQKTMDTILRGLKGVICYIDDILITGVTEAEHLEHLEQVLHRLREHGTRLKKEKCYFMQQSVQYLGHRIDAEGLHATNDKLKAITKAPPPKNVTELRSFLGLINYYGRFTAPLEQPFVSGHPVEVVSGVGAVIPHVMKDGQERPIAFASRTLLPSERNYAKEALSHFWSQ